jgi:hypothetical protein
MTRIELAMLWNLCRRWADSHPGYRASAGLLAHMSADEMTDRFGG